MASFSSPQPDRSVPAALAPALDSLQGRFQLLPEASAPVAFRVRACLLHSSQGQLCVILPANQLLDLTLLQHSTGYSWQADPQQQAVLCQQLVLTTLPALPSLLAVPCLYASSLNSLPQVYLESGVPGLLLAMDSADYLGCLQGASSADISRPLPLPNKELLSTSELASLTVRRIEQQLGKTLEIPPLPMTARKILQLKSQPDPHVDALTAIIETDPALSAQLLSWASSPLYGAGKVHSVEDAIVRVLGFNQVMSLALGLSMGKAFALPVGYEQHSNLYWKQALNAATLIDGLVRRMPPGQRPEPGLVYLAGLLHNFGHLLLAHLFPHYFRLILQHEQANPQLASRDIDRLLLGITRDEIGHSLLHRWHMPDELTRAIAWQHDATYTGPHADYAHLLRLTNQLLQAADSNTLTPDCLALCQQLELAPEQAQAEQQRILAAEQALRTLVS